MTDNQMEPLHRQTLSEHREVEALAQSIAAEVSTPQGYSRATDLLLRIADMRKRWAEFIKPAVRAAHEAHLRIKAVENQVDEPLKRAAEAHLKPACARWEQAEEERRRQEQERINRELRKQDEDARLETAGELEKSGKTAEAAAVPDAPPAPEVVLPKTTATKGISYSTKYSAKVVDPHLLYVKVAAGLAPQNFIQPDMVVLNGIARTMKESVEGQWKEWGLELVKERIVTTRRPIE